MPFQSKQDHLFTRAGRSRPGTHPALSADGLPDRHNFPGVRTLHSPSTASAYTLRLAGSRRTRHTASHDSSPSRNVEALTEAHRGFKRQCQSIPFKTKKPQQVLCACAGCGILFGVVKRTRAVHPAFTTKERGDAMSVSDALSLIGCVISLLSLLISVYLLGRDR